MNSRFLHEAKWELEEAAAYYDEQSAGLGERFLRIMEGAVADIEENPRRWPKVRGHIRRRLVKTFSLRSPLPGSP